VSVSNPSTVEAQHVYGVEVWQKALRAGIWPATNAAILQEQKRVEGMSWQRITLLILEGISVAGTIAITSGVWDLSIDTTKGKAVASAVPAAGAMIRLGSTLVERTVNTVEIPLDKIVPGYIELKPGEAQWYILYGRPGTSRNG
jgi:hypothetical protein